jgi:hypothetical protein
MFLRPDIQKALLSNALLEAPVRKVNRAQNGQPLAEKSSPFAELTKATTESIEPQAKNAFVDALKNISDHINMKGTRHTSNDCETCRMRGACPDAGPPSNDLPSQSPIDFNPPTNTTNKKETQKPDKPTPIQVGDVVMLKSGGPFMTVGSILPRGDVEAYHFGNDNGRLYIDALPPTMLTKTSFLKVGITPPKPVQTTYPG